MKVQEIREVSEEERKELLENMRSELLHERATTAMGGTASNTMRIRDLRKTIARILTIEKEEREKEGGKKEK